MLGLFNFFSFAHFSCIKIALSKSHEFLVLGIPAASIVWDWRLRGRLPCDKSPSLPLTPAQTSLVWEIPLTLLGQVHQWEWRGGAQAFRQGFPCVATDPVSYPPSNGATQLHLFT